MRKAVLTILAVVLATTANAKKHDAPAKSYDLQGVAFYVPEHHDHYYNSTVGTDTYSFHCDESGATTSCSDSHIAISYVTIAGKSYAALPDSSNVSEYTVADLAEGFGGFDALEDVLRKATWAGGKLNTDVMLGKTSVTFAYRDAGTNQLGWPRICVPWKLQRGKKTFLHETCYDLSLMPDAVAK